MSNNPDVLNRLVMSDEAHFHLCEFVNKQNYRYWSDEEPMQLNKHKEKVTV